MDRLDMILVGEDDTVGKIASVAFKAQITMDDFEEGLRQIRPSQRRSADKYAAPLPEMLRAKLNPYVERITARIEPFIRLAGERKATVKRSD